MSLESWIAVAGGLAAVCSTIAFVPQILKTWRQGGRDLSDGMLLLYLAGVLLWLGYGILAGTRAVVVANAVAALLVVLTIAGKRLRHQPPRRPRIAVDMDDVLADCSGKHLRVYNEAFGARLAPEDLDGRGLEAAVPEAHAARLRDLILEPDFFRDLELKQGSREVLRELCARYEVFVASAAMEVPTSFAAKYDWLREHLPFIPPSHIVFCGDKAVLDADYLIDDTARHFERFRGTPILFGAPHNRGETRFRRVESWDDVRALFA